MIPGASGPEPNGAGAPENASAHGCVSSALPGTLSNIPRAANVGRPPSGASSSGRWAKSAAPFPAWRAEPSSGPTALPPSIAKAGPPGCAA